MKLLSLSFVLATAATAANLQAQVSEMKNELRKSANMVVSLPSRLSAISELSGISSEGHKRSASSCKKAVLRHDVFDDDYCSSQIDAMGDKAFAQVDQAAECASNGCFTRYKNGVMDVTSSCTVQDFIDLEIPYPELSYDAFRQAIPLFEAACASRSDGSYCYSDVITLVADFEDNQELQNELSETCGDECTREVLTLMEHMMEIICADENGDLSRYCMGTSFSRIFCSMDYNGEYCLPKIFTDNEDDYVSLLCESNCMQKFAFFSGDEEYDYVGEPELCAKNANGETCMAAFSNLQKDAQVDCSFGFDCAADDECFKSVNAGLQTMGCCSGVYRDVDFGDIDIDRSCGLFTYQDACVIEMVTKSFSIVYDVDRVDLSRADTEKLKKALVRDVKMYFGDYETTVNIENNSFKIDVVLPKYANEKYPESITIGYTQFALVSSAQYIMPVCSSRSVESCLDPSVPEVSSGFRTALYPAAFLVSLFAISARV